MLLFLENKDKPGVEVSLPDGRGGDGGIDVGLIQAGKYTRIYQLKFFPEGFGSFRSITRKRQIEASFNAALKGQNYLPHWTLVMPSKFTPKELEFVHSLPQGRKLRVDTLGPREMDALLATHPQLIEQINREPILQALATLRAEDAALMDPADLRRRVAQLGKQSDAVSMYWGKNFSYENGTVIEEIIAKHPRAQEVEPLAISFTIDPKTCTPEAQRSFEKHRNYGSEQRVQFPVSSFERMGPEWFAEKTESGAVTIERLPLPPAEQSQVDLCVIDENGFTVSSHNGKLTARSHGEIGTFWEATFHGAVKLELEIPYDKSAPGSVSYTSEFSGQSISVVSNGYSLLMAVESRARIRFEIDGSPLFEMSTNDGSHDGFEPQFEELLKDLRVIWQETGVDFRFPNSLSNYERINIRIVSMLFSGKIALLPPGISIPIVLNEDAEVHPEPVQVYARMPRQAMDVLGHRIDVGPVVIYCPSVVIALEESSFLKQRTAKVTPTAGIGIRILKPNDSGRLIEPEAWNLPQIAEHPELTKK